MEQSYNGILTDYRNADFNYRLHLFLQLPKMRPDFMLIEEEERRRHATNESTSRTRSLTGQLITVLKSANNGLKRMMRFA